MNNENLIIGFNTADDAAVYKLDEQKALIQTLDFFTPVVDDPYLFGQIAATNSLSDVYAMGGKPIVAMNIVCFPSCHDMGVLGQILKGGSDKVAESGAVLVGGHTVDDKEPKYGLSVSGLVHPDKVLANSSAKKGDVLILTKPVGTGIVNTGIKADMVQKSTEEEAVKIMSHLNKYAAMAFDDIAVNAATDITGFGFLGHAMEMAKGSDLTIEIDSSKVPVMSEAEDLAKMGIIPAGMYKNRNYIQKDVKAEGVKEHIMDILYDPQTSGGLLISVPQEHAQEIAQKMLQSGSLAASIVGKVVDKQDSYIRVF